MRKHRDQQLQCDRQHDFVAEVNNYPHEKLPILSPTRLKMIAKNIGQGQLPTSHELKAALFERQRAVEKIEWVIANGRADASERILSANSTVSMTFSLDNLAEVGRDFRERQAKNGRCPKTPHLDAAILAQLQINPTASSLGLWQALSHFAEGDMRIRVDGDVMEWDFVGEPESSGNLKFNSFESKVSRLRKRHQQR